MTHTINFKNVSKRYRLGLRTRSLRSALSSILSKDTDSRQSEVWALSDVSFKIASGEAVGLIGPNGAGKSTTLRLLADITKPTSGIITVNGRVSVLLELGAGFHPELTGRENINLYGSILGLSQREIKEAYRSIVDFSGIERFLDTPLKRYSSGMYVRLAFSVAAHVKPDILLIDEVLAVGDAGFRQKCIARMEEMRQDGITLVFVSHNAFMVQKMCDRVIYLSDGKIKLQGEAEEVCKVYESDIRRHKEEKAQSSQLIRYQSGKDLIEIKDVEIVDSKNRSKDVFEYDEAAKIRIVYQAYSKIAGPIIHIRLWRDDGTPCFTVRSNQRDAYLHGLILEGKGEVGLRLQELQLYGGVYRAEIVILDSSDAIPLAIGYTPWFQVSGPGVIENESLGVYVPRSLWEVDGIIGNHD